jgi:hypothetical protein
MKTLITIASILLVAGAVSAAPVGIPGPPGSPGGGDNTAVGVGVGVGISEATAGAAASSSSSVSSEVEVDNSASVQFGRGNDFGGDTQVSIDYENRLPASSAADLMLANCQKGASAQGFGGGGSFGSTDEICHLFGLYALREARGERAEADH